MNQNYNNLVGLPWAFCLINSQNELLKIRFTYLRNKARAPQTSVLTIRAKNSAQQQASAKNRRLAMQMEKRLSAMAALRIKKVT